VPRYEPSRRANVGSGTGLRRGLSDTVAVHVLDSAAGLYRRAQSEFSNRRIPACLELLQRAELRGHSPDECAACRWNCWMLLGRFEEAWRESDAIAARAAHDPNRLWDGLPFAGKRVVIRCLHGYGDAIQFVRYASLLRCQAAGVTVQTHPQLVSLFRGMPFVDRVTTWSDGPGRRGVDWDQQIEVMELPRAFRTTSTTIPNETPYLRVEPRYRTGSFGPRRWPRVGLLWEAGDWNPARNIPLDDLRPLLDTPGVEFYSFQRGPERKKLASCKWGRGIVDLSGDSPDVVHFAADLVEMDLVLTVDTMAAHLAGALGKAVWVLLPYEADWRWMLERCDSPWYPTMRLFRQRVRGDWSLPIRQAARELQSFRQA
jgi:hypothetical protein